MTNLMNIFYVFLSIQKPYYYNILCVKSTVNSESKNGTSSLGTQSVYERHSKGIKGTYSGGTKGTYMRHRTGIKGTYNGGTKVHIGDIEKRLKRDIAKANQKDLVKREKQQKAYGKSTENIEEKIAT